jgi:hypothetical protein
MMPGAGLSWALDRGGLALFGQGFTIGRHPSTTSGWAQPGRQNWL